MLGIMKVMLRVQLELRWLIPFAGRRIDNRETNKQTEGQRRLRDVFVWRHGANSSCPSLLDLCSQKAFGLRNIASLALHRKS